jgi:hypothetical protein
VDGIPGRPFDGTSGELRGRGTRHRETQGDQHNVPRELLGVRLWTCLHDGARKAELVYSLARSP